MRLLEPVDHWACDRHETRETGISSDQAKCHKLIDTGLVAAPKFRFKRRTKNVFPPAKRHLVQQTRLL
jgi:hypothetical protein